MNQPTVAIVADQLLQRQRLRQALGKYGIEVVFNGSAGDYLSRVAKGAPAGLVIVELQDEDSPPELLEQLLSQDDSPLLFGPGPAPDSHGPDYIRWERRLFRKLVQQLGNIEPLDDTESLQALAQGHQSAPLERPLHLPHCDAGEPAPMVWVLGASLGGPAAVKAFLDCLPPGLPLAFVYAQHIDHRVAPLLGRVLARDARYPVVSPCPGNPLRCGEVVQVPVDCQLSLTEEGLQCLHERPWQGPYGPSIDQVMLNMSGYYGPHCHTILFSGMGNDGSLAALRLQALGGQLWVQTPTSCASPAMVESALDSGAVSYRGTPAELAAQLLRWLEAQSLLAARALRQQTPQAPPQGESP